MADHSKPFRRCSGLISGGLSLQLFHKRLSRCVSANPVRKELWVVKTESLQEQVSATESVNLDNQVVFDVKHSLLS